MPKQTKKKTAAKKAAPYDKSKTRAKQVAAAQEAPKNPLFVKRPKNWGIGNIQPKRDLTRFVKWPKYVRLQRQKRILYSRLRVPPAINQFTHTLDKTTARQLFAFLDKYKPETRQEKEKRLRARARELAALKKGEKLPATPKPYFVKYGINHITSLIESKKAKLLVIAHDVDPLELVVWLPALARRMGVPYCIVKGKARLGQVVHKKTVTALAITSVRKEDANQLARLCQVVKANFNDKYDEMRKQWGGGKLGQKSQDALKKRTREIQKASIGSATRK